MKCTFGSSPQFLGGEPGPFGQCLELEPGDFGVYLNSPGKGAKPAIDTSQQMFSSDHVCSSISREARLGGRGRLPVWVVSILVVLRFMAVSFPSCLCALSANANRTTALELPRYV
jgi:hypothetical protein